MRSDSPQLPRQAADERQEGLQEKPGSRSAQGESDRCRSPHDPSCSALTSPSYLPRLLGARRSPHPELSSAGDAMNRRAKGAASFARIGDSRLQEERPSRISGPRWRRRQRGAAADSLAKNGKEGRPAYPIAIAEELSTLVVLPVKASFCTALSLGIAHPLPAATSRLGGGRSPAVQFWDDPV